MTITPKQMRQASLDHENAGYREWDRQAEAQDKREAMIQGRVDALWQNKIDVVRIIVENSDVIDNAVETSTDEYAEVMDIIDRNFRIEVEADLGV